MKTMLYQCNPTAFYQSEASLKPVGCKFNFGVNEPEGKAFNRSLTNLLFIHDAIVREVRDFESEPGDWSLVMISH